MNNVDTFKPELPGGSGGVSVDVEGNIYVADFGAILSDEETMGRKIFKITPNHQVSIFAEGFKGASGNEFDSHGNLFQSNIRGNYISKIAPDGKPGVFATNGLEAPVGIAIDEADNLFVANCGSNSIQKVTRNGLSSRFVESDLLNCPNGVTFDDSKNLYVANFDNGDLIKITPEAKVSRLATLPGNNNGHIIFHDNYLYVVARSAHRIYKVSLSGGISLFAGSGEKGRKDGTALEASFCFPNDIKVSADGKYFYINEIADTSSDGKILSPMILRRIWIDSNETD